MSYTQYHHIHSDFVPAGFPLVLLNVKVLEKVEEIKFGGMETGRYILLVRNVGVLLYKYFYVDLFLEQVLDFLIPCVDMIFNL